MKLLRLAKTNDKGERVYYTGNVPYSTKAKFESDGKNAKLFKELHLARKRARDIDRHYGEHLIRFKDAPNTYNANPGSPWAEGLEVEVIEFTVTKVLPVEETY